MYFIYALMDVCYKLVNLILMYAVNESKMSEWKIEYNIIIHEHYI
jgi:hypothetical protein